LESLGGRNVFLPAKKSVRGAKSEVDQETERGAGMTGRELLDFVRELFGPKLQDKTEFRGETTYTILPADLREVAKSARYDLSFGYLIDITSIEHFGEDPRFEICLRTLLNDARAVHLRLKLKISEDEQVDTISDLWPTGELARARDLRHDGNQIQGHPDLRRILMWDGYPFFSAGEKNSVGRSSERNPRRCFH